jgi:regulator of sigma E protease
MDYIIYFILTIGILVFIHELGHYLAAKICKIRTDVFAIGFGKRLIGWNKINGFSLGALPKDLDLQGNTDFRISLLPLGGYVKIVGMIDESFDTSFAKEEPKPYEFRSKPVYQKLFVITAGIIMNLILTLVVFAGINFLQGKQVILSTTIGDVAAESFAYEAGFRSGDKILEINGAEQTEWEGFLSSLLLNDIGKNKKVRVLRDGEEVEFTAYGKILSDASQEDSFLSLGETEPMIAEVFEESPAALAGFKAYDVIIQLDSMYVEDSQKVIDIISSNSGVEISAAVIRDEDTVFTSVTPGIDGKIGIRIVDVFGGEIEFRDYGVFESLKLGVKDIVLYTKLTITSLGSVIRGDIEFGSAFGGPVRIAQFAARSADLGLISFLRFIALLSLTLAIINIMPFPAMDGGHFVIISIEGILRKELPLKLKIAIQNAGFIILLILMAFILYNDFINL